MRFAKRAAPAADAEAAADAEGGAEEAKDGAEDAQEGEADAPAADGVLAVVAGTFDAESGTIKCAAPPVAEPCELEISVALNGQDFCPEPLAFSFE